MKTHPWPEKMYLLLIPVSKSNDHITLLTTTTTQKRARKGHVSRLTFRCIQCLLVPTRHQKATAMVCNLQEGTIDTHCRILISSMKVAPLSNLQVLCSCPPSLPTYPMA